MPTFKRPSAAMVLAFVALMIALGGTALAATGQLVNIADPSNAAHLAHVDANGKLEVGDGSGPVSVDGTVTAQQSAPASFFHATRFSLNSGAGCVTLASPVSGKSLVVRDVKLDVFDDPSPGDGQHIDIFDDATCSDLVADVNPPTVGLTVVPFDPGLGIHAGSGLSARVGGSVAAEAYVDGYTVPSAAVPAASSNVAAGRSRAQR